MSNNVYDAFISFSMTDADKSHSRSYFHAKRLSNVLNNLLGIPTYFCEKDLSEREDKDFQTELMARVAECEIFVMVLLDVADYSKPYFKSERDQFIKTHPECENIMILANKDVIARINTLDIMRLPKGHPDLFDIEDPVSFQKFLCLMNNAAFEKPQDRKVDDIKVCKNCHKIFHDGNEEGTTCVFHPGKLLIKSDHLAQFSCCNQKHYIENKNDFVDISPGCCESRHEFETFK